MGKTTKQWKQGGDEDKFIEKKMKKGEIKKQTTAKNLIQSWPGTFSVFSENVVRNHLNSLKRKNGLYLSDSCSESGDADDETENNVTEAKNVDNAGSTDDIYSGYAKFTHHNYPIVCQKFRDPVTEIEKVLMVVSLPGGAHNVKAELNEDGVTVIIKYAWPNMMYNIPEMFKKQMALKHFNLYHPVVLAYKSGLENVRKRIDEAPESRVKVSLPIQVQTDVKSWKKWGNLSEDGAQIFCAEFTGYVKDYIKKSADDSVLFEK